MDWSRTKTLFIIIFLIVDLFLIYQFYQKNNLTEMDYLVSSTVDQSIRLSKDQLNILPKKPSKLTYLTAQVKTLTERDLKNVSKQDIVIENGSKIISKIVNPFLKFYEKDLSSIDTFLNRYVYKGDQYEFWSYNKSNNSITLYQTFDSMVVYNNSYGRIEIKLNNKNEMIGYSQTMLSYFVKLGEDKEQPVLLSSANALNVIGKHIPLTENLKISKVSIGYFPLARLDTGTQVLTPAWYFKLNNEKEFYINAIEGNLITD